MKRIIILCLSLALLAACQPTPEEEVVANKAEGTLESVINSNPVDDYSTDTGEGSVETLRDTLHAPDTAHLSVSGPVYGGTLASFRAAWI